MSKTSPRVFCKSNSSTIRWRRPTFLEAFCGNSTTVNNKLILCSTSFQEPTKLDINCCWSGLVYLIISVSTLHCFLSKTTWWEEYIRNCAWTGYVTLVFGTGILTGKKQEMFESLNWFQGVTFTFTGKYLHLKTVQGNKHFPFFPLARIPVPFNPKRTNIQKLPMWYQNCLSSSLSSFILVSRWLHLWFWHFFFLLDFCSVQIHPTSNMPLILIDLIWVLWFQDSIWVLWFQDWLPLIWDNLV